MKELARRHEAWELEAHELQKMRCLLRGEVCCSVTYGSEEKKDLVVADEFEAV